MERQKLRNKRADFIKRQRNVEFIRQSYERYDDQRNVFDIPQCEG